MPLYKLFKSSEPEPEPDTILETNLLPESPKMQNIHNFVAERPEKKEEPAKKVALQIFNETYAGTEYMEYANYLGKHDAVRKEFVKLLKPIPKSMVDSLRKLSSCIYLIAEAQAIDRLLEDLAVEWSAVNKLYDYRIVHIVLFSLLILNSDLHNEGNTSKFTRQEFVDTTMDAVNKEDPKIDLRPVLEGYYNDLANTELVLYYARRAPKPVQGGVKKRQSSVFSIGQMSTAASTFKTSALKATDTIEFKEEPCDSLFREAPWTFSAHMQYQDKSQSSKTASSKTQTGFFSKLFHRGPKLDQVDLYGENWRQCGVSVAQGKLTLILCKSFSYSLYNSLAELVSENIINSKQSMHKVTISFPNEDIKLLFQSDSEDICQKLVSTCNFWAARITTIPSSMFELVTNQEFGWGTGPECQVAEWKPLIGIDSADFISTNDLDTQLADLTTYLNVVEVSIEEHNRFKTQMMEVWKTDSRFDMVMENWNKRYLFLNTRYAKFEMYEIALRGAIAYRDSRLAV